MKRYEWRLSNVYGDVIDDGVFYAKSDRAAKSQASKLNPHYEWTGLWKEDKLNCGWFRYNGDARLNSVYLSGSPLARKVPTHGLFLGRSKEQA